MALTPESFSKAIQRILDGEELYRLYKSKMVVNFKTGWDKESQDFQIGE